MGRILTVTYTWARRCAIALLGGTVVLIGVVMIVMPGPAFIVIPAGLGILGLEFACARRWLKQLKTTGTDVIGRTRGWLWPSRIRHPDVSRDPSGIPVRTDSGLRRNDGVAARANKKTNYSRTP